MKIRLLHILTLSVVLCSIVPLRAAAEERTDSLLLKVYFRQDISRLELGYRGNAQMLERFTGEVNRMVNDSSYHIQDIRIRSGASPEGAFDHNRDLSWNRGRVLKDYLQAALLLPDNKFCIEAVGEDWQALREKVQRNSVPDKEKILSILDKYSSWINGHPTSTVGGPKKELMDLNGGKTWFWLLDNIYPDLRSAGNTIVCRYTHAEAPVVVAAAPAYEHRVDTLYIVEKHYYSEAGAAGAGAFAGAAIAQAAPGEKIPRRLQHQIEDRKTVVALRTNLLLPLLNVGVEVPIGNRWSVGLDYYYPWLTRGFDMTHKDCFQLLFLSPEVRYWFGREHGKGSENWSRRLLGHSIGIFGMVGKYDLGRNWSGYQGEFIAAGVDYMYGLPLGRGGAHMEFEIGLGFMRTPTRKYHVYTSGGKLFETEDFRQTFNYFGPLKAGVSIVIPIFKKVRVNGETKEVTTDEN